MKNIVASRIIFFILASICIFCYMGSMLASQKVQSQQISLRHSYLIWNAINELEDPWYAEIKAEIKDGTKLPVLPLTQIKKNTIQNLIINYDELKPFVEKLIAAREAGDWDSFLENKEKIAEKLRPIWRAAIEEARERNPKEGWWQWFRNRTRNLLQRMYNYFSSSSSSGMTQ